LEKVVIRIRKNLKTTQDRSEIYANSKRTHKKFKVGYHVYLRVKLNMRSLRMGPFSKLVPCYYGPFEDMERVGPM
jgi:hypothetical protein